MTRKRRREEIARQLDALESDAGGGETFDPDPLPIDEKRALEWLHREGHPAN